jgi:serine/threonine-protein kinase
MDGADDFSGSTADAGYALPRQLGKYTLLRRLASGGMAELFLALHRSVAGFEKLIVIKRILPSMNRNRSFIEMLLHEARIAATLSHPNVVQIFDVGQAEGTYFIAMEHIHGEDIQSIVKAMKKKELTEFPLEHTLSIVLGTCAGLAYAHERRDLDGRPLSIVHRDISPRNIVVSFTGDVKIVDFGIAKSGVEPGEETDPGHLKGKAPYMSPEQAAGQEIDWRSDIFSVGVVLFELTTGRRLFKGASEFETLKLIVDKAYPRPEDVKPGYPKELSRIVMRALAKDREARYQSARDMQADLEAFARHERVPVSAVSLTTWMDWLFEDKLAEQKEALSDVKQLADVIAAQHGPSLYDGPTGTGSAHAATSLSTLPPPHKRSALPYAIAGVAMALGAGGVLVVQRELAVRRELAARRHEAQAATVPVPLPAAPSASASARQGALTITSTPEGAGIWIDGDLRPETTPARLAKLPLGAPFALKLTREGFEPYRAEITLSEAEPEKKVVAELRSGSVTVELKVDPAPTVWLDGKPWKGDRSKITGLSAGEEHTVVLSAAGYQPKSIKLTAQPGETKTISEALAKAEGGSHGDDKPAPAGAPAKVRVGAKGGFCSVTVNGTSYGPTPVEAPVTAGAVRVSCKPEGGAAMTQIVQVAAGETAKVSFKVD